MIKEHFNDRLVMLPEVPTPSQSKHLLHAQKLVLEKIVQKQDLISILDTLCVQIEKVIFPSICAIFLPDDHTHMMNVQAAPSGPISFRSDLDGFDPNEFSEACGITIPNKNVVVFPETETDPRWKRIRNRLKKYGIQSCWSIPISSKSPNPVGTFVVFYQEHQRPSAFDLDATETAAHLASLAIQHREKEHHSSVDKERFQDLFDSAPIAYIASTMDGKILSANACAAKLTGMKQHELPGRSVLDLYAPTLHGRRKAERVVKWIQHGLEVEGEELELERPDGTRRWVNLTVRLIRDSMGNPIERRSILEDISSRKQAEHLLDEQKSILEMIAKGQPLRHTLSRLCEGIETLSPKIKCSIHQLNGTKLYHLASPSLPESYRDKIAVIEIGSAAGSCGTAAYRREPVIVSDIATDPLWNKGRSMALKLGLQACWAIPIFSSDNEVLGTMAMYYPQPRTPCREDWEIIEVSTKLAGIALEQERDRTALKQSEARYRTLYEDNPTMYFTVALDGTVRSVNRFGASRLGFTPSELLGTSVFSLCHKDDLPEVRHKFESYLQGPSNLEYLEFRNVRKDGTVIWVRETIRMVKSAEQESVLLLVCEDITERKKAEQALQSIVEGTGSIIAVDFFYTLTRALAQCLNVKYAFIAEWSNTEQTAVQTLSFWNDSQIADSFSYELDGTPCQLVLGDQVCFYPKDVQRHFPKDQNLHKLGVESFLGIPLHNSMGEVIGLLVAMDNKPLPTDAESIPIVKVFSARAAAELERKRADDALRRSEGRLRQVIDLVPHFIFAKDKNGRFILGNQAVADVYGTTIQHLIGKTDEDFAQSPKEIEHFRHDDLEVLESGKVKSLEESITDAEGQIRHLHTTKIPFVFADTVLPALLGVAIDITDRKRGEEALQLTQQVFDILPDHVSVVGSDYRYRRVNAVYEQVHGLPAKELIGKHISHLLGEQTFRDDIKPYFDRCLAGESVSFERWFQFHDGQKRFMSVTYSPLWTQRQLDCVEAVVVNSRDLTQRKHMEEALQESEGRLRILLDERIRISQDLHDHVLQSIYAVGLIIAAIRKPLETQNFSEVYEFLDQAVLQVNNSIVDIRGFIEGLPQDLEDIGDFSTELSNLVQSMSIPEGPTFQLRLDQKAINLLSKQDTLHLLNIARESMSNCLRHAKATKSTISLARKNGKLRFEIRDNGIGFNHQERSHAGHGLINMKARSEHLHGTITIRSAPNKGTRVIINMPTTEPK